MEAGSFKYDKVLRLRGKLKSVYIYIYYGIYIYTLSFDNLEISRVCKKNLVIGIISLQNRVLDTKTWFLGKTRLTIKINIKNHLP